MSRFFPFAVLCIGLAFAPPAHAQEAVALTVGTAHADTLGPADTHAYTLDLAAGQFVYAEADQRTVDVMIAVRGPAGEPVHEADRSARGPEPFLFTTEAAGTYRILITPFEAQSGAYTLAVERVEPVATTPEGVVDQRMAPFAGTDRPGGIVAVIRNGAVSFAQPYGMADLTHGLPITPETRFNIGSVSKQFAGIFFAMMAEEGRLSLDDDVRKYAPELPDFGPTVTLRHLLTHTSGYREVYGMLGMQGRRVDGDILERQDALDVVRRQQALQFPPGSWYLYNSTAYVILTTIAERITGQPYPDWMQANVFDPLGMTQTMIERTPGEVIPNAAFSYTTTDHGTYREDFEAYAYYGATDVYTTVGDLARWMRNFHTSELGGPGVMARMKEISLLANGDTLSYTLGITLDKHLGLDRISHGGSTGGYRAFLGYYPKLDAGVVVLSNTGAVSTRSTAEETAAAFFADVVPPAPEPAAAAAPAPVAARRLAAYAGLYRAPGMGVFTLTPEDGGLAMTSTIGWDGPLTAQNDTTFMHDGLWFQFAPARGQTTLRLRGRGESALTRVAPSPEAPDLKAYTGRYFSEEAEAFYTVTAEADTLMIHHRRLGMMTLRPLAADLYSGPWPVSELHFVRDATGTVTGFLATSGRTIDVAFTRVE